MVVTLPELFDFPVARAETEVEELALENIAKWVPKRFASRGPIDRRLARVDAIVPETSHSTIELLFFIIRYQFSIFLFEEGQNAVILVGVIIFSILVVV